MPGDSDKKTKEVLTTCIAGGISTVLVVSFLLFVFLFGNEEKSYVKKTDEKEQKSVQASGGLSFTADTYEVETNQEMDMREYLQCEGVSQDDIAWSSNTEGLTVGSKGHVVAKDYGVSGILTASSKTDESLRAECVIKSRSEEEDFVYQVESLNGEHTQDETTEDGVVQLAYTGQDEQSVDVKAQTREPGKRDEKDTWDRELFYTLEEINPDSDEDGKINSYRIEKKKFENKETGNEIEYEIYHNPDTDKIHKIVSIEYMEKHLEISEYYYTDDELVNFIYVYSDVNYTPSYATPDRDGDRHFFCNDTMVSWRIVKDGKTTNYCCNDAEKKRMSKDSRRNIKLYKDCSKKWKDKYDKREAEMINAAYNTLDKVKNSEGVSTISGYVELTSGEGAGGTSVELESADYKKPLCLVPTEDNGYYEVTVPIREANYNLAFKKDGCLDEKLYGIEANESEISLSQEVVYLSREDTNVYDCELNFYDALNKAIDGMGMEQVYDLYVTIRRGVNNRSGNPVFEGYVSGGTQMISLAAGMYTVQMSSDGYMDTYSSLFVSSETGNNLAVYATPELSEDEYRIVLTWGAVPSDLDSHLFAPANGMPADDCHICYYHMADSLGNVSLDVDDVDGYGPETTTISHIEQGQYKFYVCDFTNCSQNQEESLEMSNSSATVRVYGRQGLIQTFYVPVNRKGVIWEVFEIRDGKVIPSQRYYDAIGNKTWWQAGK